MEAVFWESARLIAAIGASAGGIEALRAVLRAAILGSGISYIVQMHLDPDRESSLAEILARDSALPVESAQEGQQIQPDRVLVIPPGVTAGMQEDLDLSRFCAAPLITYCAAKEMSHEHRQDG